jgi:hypothetical protein
MYNEVLDWRIVFQDRLLVWLAYSRAHNLIFSKTQARYVTAHIH